MLFLILGKCVRNESCRDNTAKIFFFLKILRPKNRLYLEKNKK